MTRYLLDSNAVNAFTNRHSPLADRVKGARKLGNPIRTCEPVVAELYYGIERSSSRDEHMVRLGRILSQIRVWPFDRQAAREYGRIAAELRRRGRPMQVIDMMIAAVAFTHQNCIVVTTDSDLSAVPGLATANWMST